MCNFLSASGIAGFITLIYQPPVHHAGTAEIGVLPAKAASDTIDLHGPGNVLPLAPADAEAVVEIDHILPGAQTN